MKKFLLCQLPNQDYQPLLFLTYDGLLASHQNAILFSSPQAAILYSFPVIRGSQIGFLDVVDIDYDINIGEHHQRITLAAAS